MTGQTPKGQVLAVALAWIAGATDAIGFLETGGFFVSFMSGNSTRLAVGAASQDRTLWSMASALVVLFVTGVTAGTLLGSKLGQRRARVLLLVQAALLGLGAWLLGDGRTGAGIAAAVLAMALANTIVAEGEGEGALGVTYVTGALVRVGRGLADAIRGGAPLGWAPHLLLWLGLVAGAATGAVLELRWGSAALWVPAGVSLLIALFLARGLGYAEPARGPGDRRRG